MWQAITLIGALMFLPAVASAQQPCTPNAQRVVDAIYRQVLERSADRGSATFVERLNNNSATVKDIVREVAKSPEHVQRFLSSQSQDQGATYLYRHLLGRQPDAEGLRGHSQGLVTNGPSAVIDLFVNSVEYQQSFGDDTVPGSRLRFCGLDGEEGAPVSRRDLRFQNFDRNYDGIITRSEWRGSRESFVVNDWNGDGVLSGEEVRIGGRRNDRFDDDENFEQPASARLTPAERFANLDVNRNGRLSYDEWRGSRANFDYRDQNGDGVITRREFLATAVR